jgi:hypothetical protein
VGQKFLYKVQKTINFVWKSRKHTTIGHFLGKCPIGYFASMLLGSSKCPKLFIKTSIDTWL